MTWRQGIRNRWFAVSKFSRPLVRCGAWGRDMRTHKAVLHDNQIEWLEHPPERIDAAQVYITLLEEPDSVTPSNRGRLMAEILAELAQRETFSEISDPVAWQRDLRSERVLPDRES